jgi:hypothetical protein
MSVVYDMDLSYMLASPPNTIPKKSVTSTIVDIAVSWFVKGFIGRKPFKGSQLVIRQKAPQPSMGDDKGFFFLQGITAISEP